MNTKPEHIFLTIALIFGILFSIITPPMFAPDEGGHYRRTILFITGNIWENKKSLQDTSEYRLQANQEMQKVQASSDNKYNANEVIYDLARPEINPNDVYQESHKSPAILYTPIPYLPAILTHKIAYSIGTNPAKLLYYGRLSLMLFSSLLIFAAIRVIPTHKWLLVILSLMPAVLFSRSVMTADSITISACFLYIAVILKYTKNHKQLSKHNIAVLVLISSAIALCKSAYIGVPFLCLLLPISLFSNTKKWLISICTIIMPGLLAAIIWSLEAKNQVLSNAVIDKNGRLPSVQLEYIIYNPFEYLSIIVRTLNGSLGAIQGSVANLISALGTYTVYLPMWLVWLLLILLLIHAVTSQKLRLSNTQRFLCIAIFCGTILLTLTLLYIQYTPYQHDVILGFQPRYLIPILPLLLISAIPNIKIHAKLYNIICMFSAIVVTSSLLLGLWLFINRLYE